MRNTPEIEYIPAGTTLETTHANCITEIRVISKSSNKVSKFSTTGKDGKLVIWELDNICSAIAGLKI